MTKAIQKPKRMLAWLLAVSMTLALVPGLSVPTQAAPINDANYTAYFKQVGGVWGLYQGTDSTDLVPGEGNTWDATEDTLTLTNFSFRTTASTGLEIADGSTTLTIKVVGGNGIYAGPTTATSVGLFSSRPLVIENGDSTPGVLEIRSGKADVMSRGIYAGKSLTIRTTVSATGDVAGNNTYGILANNGFVIEDGANITAIANKGSSTYGISCGNVTMSGGTVRAIGQEATGNNSHGFYTASPDSEKYFTGGTITAQSSTIAPKLSAAVRFYTEPVGVNIVTLTAPNTPLEYDETTRTYGLGGVPERNAKIIGTPPAQHTISLSASPSAGGHVTGDGTVADGASHTVTATANSGYSFVNWTEGNVEVSTSPAYTFTVSKSRTLAANFIKDSSGHLIKVSASPSAGGHVTGGGTVADGTSHTVTATANSGYSFVNWTESGAEVSTSTDYTFTASHDRTLVANFNHEGGYTTITVSANPSAGGRVTGDGTVVDGDNHTVTARANSGYKFVNWTEGGTIVATSTDYSFIVSGNRSLTANFNKQSTGGGGGGGGSLSNKEVVTSDDVDLPVTTDKDGNKVTAVIDEKESAELIKDAKEHGNVVIRPEGANGAKTVEVVIPKDTVAALANDTKASIEFNAGDGFTAKIPHSEFAKITGDMTITATKNGDNSFSVSAKSGDNDAAITTMVSFKNADGNVAYRVDENGNKEVIKLSVVEGDTVYAKVTTPATIVIEKHENLFTDMLSHPMRTDADFVANRGLFVGISEGVFAPNSSMTMGMMASVLHRLAGTPSVAVSGSEWYAPGLSWASGNNYITSNDPSKIITRLDLATTLYRYAKSIGLSVEADANGTMPFSDVSHLTGEAKDAMAWAYATGILQGYGNETIGAENECTRIQVAAMFERFIQLTVK